MYYDSLIAKLVVYGDTREQAAARLASSLDGFAAEGPATNLLFLAALVSHPKFKAGELSTVFIAEEYPDGFDPAAACSKEMAELLGAVAVLAQDRCGRTSAGGLEPRPC